MRFRRGDRVETVYNGTRAVVKKARLKRDKPYKGRPMVVVVFDGSRREYEMPAGYFVKIGEDIYEKENAWLEKKSRRGRKRKRG